jgi:MFS family permease
MFFKDGTQTTKTTSCIQSMCLCFNAYLFTLVIPPALLSYLNAELGPDPTYTWITTSWNLGGAIFVTIAGRLSDIFGRRYFFMSGAIILIIGSIVSATGKSIGQMIAGGAIFGMGSGFLEMSFGAVQVSRTAPKLQPNLYLTCFQEIVPNKYRMITIGMFDAFSIIAQSMPLVAWSIIKFHKSWRASYYIMIAFQCFNVIFLICFYNPPTFETKHSDDGHTKLELLKKLDWLGLFLFIAGKFAYTVRAGINKPKPDSISYRMYVVHLRYIMGWIAAPMDQRCDSRAHHHWNPHPSWLRIL